MLGFIIGVLLGALFLSREEAEKALELEGRENNGE